MMSALQVRNTQGDRISIGALADQNEQMQTKLGKEFFFSKIDFKFEGDCKFFSDRYSKTAFTFVDFEEHDTNIKQDFPVGKLMMILHPLDHTQGIPLIYEGELTSLGCFNTAIEWNKAYFQKIRMCFFRKLTDIHFRVQVSQPKGAYMEDEDF